MGGTKGLPPKISETAKDIVTKICMYIELHLLIQKCSYLSCDVIFQDVIDVVMTYLYRQKEILYKIKIRQLYI